MGSLTNEVAAWHRAECDRLQCGPAAPAAFSSLTSGAAPRHRPGEGQLRQQAWRLLRTLWRHDIAPKMITYSAAIRDWQVCHILRAVQCHAIGSERITSNATSARVKGAACTSRPGISYERCGGMASRRRRSPTMRPSACEKGRQDWQVFISCERRSATPSARR